MPDLSLAEDAPFAQGRALDQIAAEVRALDEATRGAADGVAQSASGLRAGRRDGADPESELLAELAESVISRIEGIRDDCATLSGLLTRAQRAASGGTGASSAVAVRPPQGESPNAAATRMAIACRTRSEIEHHLRAELGIGDPRPILDEVFGEQLRGAA